MLNWGQACWIWDVVKAMLPKYLFSVSAFSSDETEKVPSMLFKVGISCL